MNNKRWIISIFLSCLLVSGTSLQADAESAVAEQPFKPFPQHVKYHTGVIKPNHVSQVKMDQEVARLYDEWKGRYLKKHPKKSDRYYVYYNLEGYSDPKDAVSSSEGHGYGMLATALMAGHDPNAKTYFDGLYRFYKDHPSSIHGALMAWQQVITSGGDIITNPDGGDDSATDGDLDIAYALLLADKQWGSNQGINYLAEGKKVIQAILEKDVNHREWTLKLGDWAGDSHPKYGTGTRPSDFMLGHLKAFRSVTGNTDWDKVTDKTYGVINSVYQAYSPNTGLLPDFIVKKDGTHQPAPPYYLEGANDNKYSWNSCRTPWRLPVDYLMTGDSRGKGQLAKMNSWIQQKTGGDPSKIRAGYDLGGNSLASYNSVAFATPFAVSAMIDSSNQQWLNRLWDHSVKARTSDIAYFDNSIRLLSLITVSGNWWEP